MKSTRNSRREERRKTRRRFAMAGIVVAGLAAAAWFGPRVDTTFRPKSIALPDRNLEAYLAAAEARFSDVVPNTEKTITWANPDHARTPVSIVYLHGFSATRQEVHPLCDQLARHFGANVFYTRMTGHGRTGAALAEATVSDWLNDALEAYEVGRRIGDRVIIVGTSTGGSLAAWLALKPRPPVVAYVLISPNFFPKDHRAAFLTWPWAGHWVPRVFGSTRHRTPVHPAEKLYWTNEYPTAALFPMMGLVKLVNDSPLEMITTPMVVVYSPEDPVVDPAAIERGFTRIGSVQKALIPIPVAGKGSRHVLAGEIMAAENTAAVADVITGFVEKVRPPAQP